MYLTNKCNLLTLRRPTKVSKICASVKKPPGGIPRVGFPLWREIALDQKLPIVPGPKGTITFSREKIGRNLWQSPTHQDFTLHDPNCHISFAYDPLHDKHLKGFFTGKKKRRLRELGLITSDDRPICNLKQYNDYRRYLNTFYLSDVHRERSNKEKWREDRAAVAIAQQLASRDIHFAEKADFRKEMSQPLRDKMAQEQAEKKKKELVRQRRYNNCIIKLERKKKAVAYEMKEKAKIFADKINKRTDNANIMEYNRRVLNVRRWKKYHEETNERLRDQHKRRQESRMERYLNHMRAKVSRQIRRKKREREILKQFYDDMKHWMAVRNGRVQLQRHKLDELLVKVKKERLQKKSRTEPSTQLKAITKAMQDKSLTGDNKWLVHRSLTSTLAELRNKSDGHDLVAILQNTREKIERHATLPREIACATDDLLNNVITEYVKRSVRKLLDHVIKRVMEYREKTQVERKKSFAPRRKSMKFISFEKRAPSSSKNILQSLDSVSKIVKGEVSFGDISTIDQQYYVDADIHLLPVNDRPPTPIPSVIDLAELAFNDPDMINIVNESHEKKKSLEKLLNALAKVLLKLVLESTPPPEYKNRYKRKFRRPSVGTGSKLKEITATLTEKILTRENEVLNPDELGFAIDTLNREVMRQTISKKVEQRKEEERKRKEAAIQEELGEEGEGAAAEVEDILLAD